jgi:hypothetical protein
LEFSLSISDSKGDNMMAEATYGINSRGRPLQVRTLSLLFVLAASGLPGVSAFAQAGGKNNPANTLPPVTITVDYERFEYRAELGGVYDKDLGVIWGYSVIGVNNWGTSYTYAKTQIAPNYGEMLEARGDRAVAAGFPEDASLYYAAADIAALYSNRRLPTLTEARSAVAAGMFTYGPDGLNIWTGSPTDVFPGLPYNGLSTWTNDTKGKQAWIFAPHDGGAALISPTSGVDAIIVRSYAGP